MSTTADRFGSISADAYRTPTTQALPPFSHHDKNADSTPPSAPDANTNEPTVVYNVDQADVPPTQDTHHDAPAHAPNSWAFGRDVYKNGGVSDSGV